MTEIAARRRIVVAAISRVYRWRRCRAIAGRPPWSWPRPAPFHEPPAPVSQRAIDRPHPRRHEADMGAKQELLQQAEQEYDGRKAAIKGLEDVQMRQGWLGRGGVPEIVAHIPGWDREMVPAVVGRGR